MKHPNNKALYVTRKSPYGEGQVVLHVTDTFKEGYLCFDDTNRGHMLKGEIIASDDDSFTFFRQPNEEWVFEIVTIEKFKENVYRCVYNGKEIAEVCDTTEDLWEHFRQLFPLNDD